MAMKPCEGALIFLLGLGSVAANVVAPTKSELEMMYAGAAQALNGGNVSEALETTRRDRRAPTGYGGREKSSRGGLDADGRI